MQSTVNPPERSLVDPRREIDKGFASDLPSGREPARPVPRMTFRARTLFLLLLLPPLLGVPLFVAGEVGSQVAPPSAGPSDCTPAERRAVLEEEQATVLRRLEGFRELRSPADLRALGAPPRNYLFLAHQFTSFRGIGLTIINPFGTARAGVPNLLFYAPRKGADATDPRGPDFPYTLVGWGYGVPYQPGRLPAVLACIGLEDWHIHERGVHPISTGGMTVMPPAETHYGASPGSFLDAPAMEPVVGFPHGRSWTIHLWLEDNGTPSSAILDPHDPPAGIDPGIGSSFYFPESPPADTVSGVTASAIEPFVVRAGAGEQVSLAESTFAFAATGDGTAGAFTLIEAVLEAGSVPPAHIHHKQAEAFYILDGEMTFQVGGRTFAARTGDFIFLPRGVPHAYRVDGDGTARVLLMASPAGLDRFFKEASQGDPRDPRIATAHGIEAVGPPLAPTP
jgi:quercetin dioxygenase-like cupin family protein